MTLAMKTIQCHVIRRNVTVVTDLDDTVTLVICPEYVEPTGMCRMRRAPESGGPLSQLVGRVREAASLAAPCTRCYLKGHAPSR